MAWIIKPHGYHDDNHEDAIDESFGYYSMAVGHKPDPLSDLSDKLWAEFRSGWPLDEGVVTSASGSISCFVVSFMLGLLFLSGSVFLLKKGLWSPVLIQVAILVPFVGFIFLVHGYFQHRRELSQQRREYLEKLAPAFRKEGFIVDYGHKSFGYHYARFRHIDGTKFDHHGDRHLRLNAFGEYTVVASLFAFGFAAIIMIFSGMSVVQVIDEDLNGYNGWAMNTEAIKAAEYNIKWAPAVLDGTLFKFYYRNPDFEGQRVKLSEGQRDALDSQQLILAQFFGVAAYFSLLGFFVSFCRMPHEWDRHSEHTQRERQKHCAELRQFHALITVFSFSWVLCLFLFMFSMRASNFCGPYFIELPFDISTGVGTGAIVHEEIPVSCKMGYLVSDVLGTSCISFLFIFLWWLMEEEWGILSGDHDVRENDNPLSMIRHTLDLSVKV